MKPHNQDIQCPGRDSNREHLQYKREEMNGTYDIDGGEMRHIFEMLIGILKG
jgi:hypothetical protein